jgi:hypothetical protein
MNALFPIDIPLSFVQRYEHVSDAAWKVPMGIPHVPHSGVSSSTFVSSISIRDASVNPAINVFATVFFSLRETL